MVTENHYPLLSELTTHQKEKIAELRAKTKDILATYPEYDTDFSLLRWLMGWDYNIDVIVPKMRYAIETLVNLGMNKHQPETIEQINADIKNMSNVAEYFPGGIMGQSRTGDVVYLQAMAKAHPKSLVKAGATSQLYQLCISETEMSFKVIRKEEQKTGRKLGVIIIMDLDGFNTDLLYTPTLKVYMSLLTMLQGIFPDFARKIFIINCPMMMSAVYSVVSPVLSVQTREKVRFLDKEWKIHLIEEIGDENIFTHWGGSKKAEHPCGDIRMGGKVPETLWYNDTHKLEGDRTKVSVSARSKTEIKMIGETGKHFHWLWRVSSGDIDFSIEKDGRVVWPVFRCLTEFHPEIGSFKIEEAGEYKFIFDNSHGKIFGKDVKYKIVME
uniref:CRAL-TRIO domain-containing protein n=1 Tax=Caenorhabditis japonica TaxID=281687 RepID=A0A8R1HKJ6_CAEJA